MPWRPWSPGNDTYLRLGDDVSTRLLDMVGMAWLANHPLAACPRAAAPSTPRD
ncbi:MAG: hypothetical protein ABIT10_07045 [Alteraurantiacibacter sp.]